MNIDSSKSAIFTGERWCEAPFIHKAALSDVRRPAGHDLLTALLVRPVRPQRRHVFFARLNSPCLAANGMVTVNIAVDCDQQPCALGFAGAQLTAGDGQCGECNISAYIKRRFPPSTQKRTVLSAAHALRSEPTHYAIRRLSLLGGVM